MALRMTKAHLAKLVGANVPEKAPRKAQDARKPRPATTPHPPPRESAGEAAFAAALRLHGRDLPPAVREFVFVPGRRFRADFAWPDAGLLTEIDGGTYAPGGGRHAGEKDKEKANLAACLGYRVLHFSPQQVERDPAGCVALVRRALQAH
jgi:hypothetical protein